MKQYIIGIEDFQCIKETLELVLMPNVMNAMDEITAEQVRECYARVSNISLTRYLSEMQRKAYCSGDMDAVRQFKEMRGRLLRETK